MAKRIPRPPIPDAASDAAVHGHVPVSAGAGDVVLRILHTADWHLGRRFPTFSEEAQRTLSRADGGDPKNPGSRPQKPGQRNPLRWGSVRRSVPERRLLEGLAKTLRDHPGPHVPIFPRPGNHDPLTSESCGRRATRSAPGCPTGCTSSIATASHELSPDAVRMSPCRSRAAQHDPRWHCRHVTRATIASGIGCVHGCTFDMKDYQANFPISRDAGVQRGLDYLAIGDTHSFRDVTERSPVPTVYPGFRSRPTSTSRMPARSRWWRSSATACVSSVAAEPVGYWRWLDVHCRDMHQLRTLLTLPELQRHVVRLRLDMAVTLSRKTKSSASSANCRELRRRTGAPASCWSTRPTCSSQAGLRQHLSRRSPAGRP